MESRVLFNFNQYGSLLSFNEIPIFANSSFTRILSIFTSHSHSYCQDSLDETSLPDTLNEPYSHTRTRNDTTRIEVHRTIEYFPHSHLLPFLEHSTYSPYSPLHCNTLHTQHYSCVYEDTDLLSQRLLTTPNHYSNDPIDKPTNRATTQSLLS